MRHIGVLSLILSFFILSLLTSCGGGDGGGEPSIQTQNVRVAGAVTVEGSKPNTVFNVEVISLSADRKQLDRKTTQTVLSQDNPSLNGSFSTNVKAAKGGTIVVKASAPGYTEPTRTLNYNGGDSLSVNLDAQSVTVQTVDLQKDGLAIQSSSGRRYVRIAFTRNEKGGAKAVLGAQALNTGSKLIDLAIPLDALQANTLTVSYRAYDPSDPNDYANFPGEETADGERLVSIGFDYLDIKDENGENPFVQGLSAQLVNGEYYRILRYVDCTQINQIRNLLGSLDEDPSKAGVQLTFYAYDWDQGGWVVAGQGTFVDNSNIDFMNSEWDTIVQNGCDPNIPSSNNNDGIASCSEYGIFTDENDVCQDGSDYVVISVTNPALQWKNLDYIIPPGRTISCDITVVDENNNPVVGAWVYANANCMAYVDGTTDSNGKVHLETIGYSDPCTANVSAWYNMQFAQGTANFDSGNQCQLTLQIENPYDCYVEGKVVDENNTPVEGIFVYTYGYQGEIYAWQYGVTDSNGNFSIPTLCNTDMYLYVKWNLKVYNVNGTKDNDEVSDNGNTANVGTIQIVNDPPYGYVYMWQMPELNSDLTLYICATDWENNYPVSYDLKRNGSSVKSGSLSTTSTCDTYTFTLTSAGTYTFTGTFTDSKGKSATAIQDEVFSIDSSNHYIKASIWGSGDYYNYSYGSMIFEGVYVWLYVDAYDSSSNHTVTSTASYTCFDQSDNETESGSGLSADQGILLCSDSSTHCDGTINISTAYCDFDVTITDGTLTINHTKRVTVFGRP